MALALKVLFLTATVATHIAVSDAKLSEMESFRQILGALSRQVMMQQMFVEERIRSDGDSGVKQVRVSRKWVPKLLLRSTW